MKSESEGESGKWCGAEREGESETKSESEKAPGAEHSLSLSPSPSPSTFALRDYQLAAAEAIEDQWRKHQSTLCVLPTGCGKTVLFAEIIRRRQPGRALVIAHREELIVQAREKIEQIAGLECEIEMADQVASTSLFHAQPVVIASIQTLVSGAGRPSGARLKRFPPDHFSTIVIDEFHHATAASYRQVLDYYLQNPEARLLGVTATPDRTDQEALSQVCQSVAYSYGIAEAIEDGWLVPVEQQLVTIDGLDFSGIQTRRGDLHGADLARVMEQEKNLHGLCAATLEIAGDRRAIVFTSSVHHAEMVCNILNRHRPGIAEWVCGETDREARRQIMANVQSGRTQILVNVGVATEGFDAPGVEVIVMGRPTKSRSLYAQMAGRATRPWPGVVDGPDSAAARRAAIAASAKKSCLIVDFVGNSGRHKLITAADILGGKHSEEARARVRGEMETAGGAWLVSAALDEAEEEIRAEQRLAAERRRRLEEAAKQRIVARARYQTRAVNPFDAFDLQPILAGSERGEKPLSLKQRQLLLKHGVDPDSMSATAARAFIREMFRRWERKLCTFKQAALLKKYGFETRELTLAEAKRWIDRIAANRWKLPVELRPPVTSGGSEGEWL
jgi:superfamily II DNA or RNA helicase